MLNGDVWGVLGGRAPPRGQRPSQGRLKIESRVALSPRIGASQLGCGRVSIRSGGTPGYRVPVVGGGRFSARASRSVALGRGPTPATLRVLARLRSFASSS